MSPSADAAWRDVHRGRVWRAQACRIVEESPDLIALWLPPGTPAVLPVDERGKRIRIPSADWELEHVTWTLRRALPRPAGSCALDLSLPAGRCVHALVRQLRTTPAPEAVGFDTFDEKLDLVVQADGSYRWKDEDELEQAAAVGLLDAEAVRAEAARVLEEWPFPTGWEDWQPDPSWPLPQLPPGWDVVES